MDNSLSSQWRVNDSTIKNLELAEVLRSLKRVVSHHTTKITSIGYTTEGDEDIASYERGHVLINPAPILNLSEYPVPADIFDVLTGLALHEVGHQMIGSDVVSEHLSGYADLERNIISPVRMLGEDVVVDSHFTKDTKQKKYINSARKYFVKDIIEGTGSPLSEAMNSFSSIMLYNQPPGSISVDGQEILKVLFKHFKGLTQMTPDERAKQYRKASLDIMGILRLEVNKQRLSDPRGKRLRAENSIENYTESKAKKMVEDTMESLTQNVHGKTEPMSLEQQAKIEEILEEETSDVTNMMNRLNIQSEAPEEDENDQDVLNHIRQKETQGGRRVIIQQSPRARGYVIPDPVLVKELQWLRNIKTDRDTVTERLLLEGKIDKRNLHRIAIDQRIFRQKKMKPRQKRQIWLVMDASGSMDGSPLFALCAAVHQVIPDSRIYLYDSPAPNTVIRRADDRKGMKDLRCGDSTPSGDAVAYAAHILQKEGGGILIHFTDGGCNAGMSIESMYNILQRKCPQVTLINALYVEGHYKTRYSKVSNVELDRASRTELAAGFAKLLKQAVMKMWDLE